MALHSGVGSAWADVMAMVRLSAAALQPRKSFEILIMIRSSLETLMDEGAAAR